MGKIRRYEAKDFDQVVALDSQVFEDQTKRLDKLHKWLYALNPAKDPKKFNGWVFEDGKIFGYVSGMPCLIKIQNKNYRAIIAQNTSVHQQHQGKGIGKKLYRQLFKDGDIFLALSMTNQSHYMLLKEGCLDICADYLATYNIVSKKTRLKQLLSSLKRRNMRLMINVFKIIFNEVKIINHSGISLIEIYNFNEKFDDLWKRASKSIPILTVRNRAYLNWRYIKSPTNYVIIAAEKLDLIKGYIVLDVSKNKYGTIVDFLVCPEDNQILKCLLLKAISIFKEKKLYNVKCIMPNDQRFSNVFHEIGFRKESKRILFVAKSCSENIPQTFLENTANWLITMGDSDVCL